MREITSAIANKIIKGYNEEIEHLYAVEQAQMTYTQVEGVDPVKPEYNFAETRNAIRVLEAKVLELKHELNMFNSRTEIPELGMTIDQALIRMAQLSTEKKRLEAMRKIQPRTVNSGYMGRASNRVEYTVANFSLSEVEDKYNHVTSKLNQIQLGLDRINNTEIFVVEDALIND